MRRIDEGMCLASSRRGPAPDLGRIAERLQMISDALAGPFRRIH
jgi:hypothetical protein